MPGGETNAEAAAQSPRRVECESCARHNNRKRKRKSRFTETWRGGHVGVAACRDCGENIIIALSARMSAVARASDNAGANSRMKRLWQYLNAQQLIIAWPEAKQNHAKAALAT